MSETSSILPDLLIRPAAHPAAAYPPGQSLPGQSSPGQPGLPAQAAAASGLRRLAVPMLLAGDALSLVLALSAMTLFAAALLGRGGHGGIDRGACLAAVLVALLANAALGLYETTGRGAVERFRLRVWCSLIVPFLGLALLALARPIFLRDLLVLIGAAWLWLPLALAAEGRVVGFLLARSAWGMRALLVGDHATTERLAAHLLAHPEIGLRPVACCGPGALDGVPGRLPRLGGLGRARTAAALAEVAIVTLSPAIAPLDLSTLPFRRVLVLPQIDGLPSLWLRSRGIGSGAALDFRPSQGTVNHPVKRALDIAIALPLLFAFSPLIMALALAIRLLSRGPAFYVQRRVGWNGRPLHLLKLRSMHLDAEARLKDLLASDPAAALEWRRCVKLSRDPRILPVIGRFIRRTSLDELPQLWNVVRGDMSLVGPRPFPAYHLDMFDPEFRVLRESVRPGLTGLWQVSERSDADIVQQQRLDTFYIRNWSPWFDLYIALRTLPAVFAAAGAR